MGVDYTAYGFEGCRINKDELFVRGKAPGCWHRPPADAKFCPACGKPAWVAKDVPIAEYDEEQDALGPLEVIWSTDRAEAFVAVPGTVTKVGGYGRSDPEMIESGPHTRDVIQGVLEPLGLWDEEDFGFWVVLRCSR